MTEQTTKERYSGWADIQFMGHVHHRGFVSEIERFGVTLIRVEPITYDGTPGRAKEYHPSALYSFEEVTEEEIRREIAERQEANQRRRRLLEPPPRPEITEEAPPTLVAAVQHWLTVIDGSPSDEEANEALDGIAMAYAEWTPPQPAAAPPAGDGMDDIASTIPF